MNVALTALALLASVAFGATTTSVSAAESPSALVDFGPGSAPPAPGFQRDGGGAFDPSVGYGWLISPASMLASRERGCSSPPESARTFVFSAHPRSWEMVLPNGDYEVTVSVGDCAFAQGPHRVTVEGAPLVSDEPSSASSLLVRTRRVRVLDGRLTVSIGGGGGYTTLNHVEVLRAPQQPATLLAVNFQTGSAGTPPGFEADSGASWDQDLGRGWSEGAAPGLRERDRNSDKALDTFAFTGSSTATYEVALPEGTYEVKLAVGDPTFPQGPHRVVVEGFEVLAGETSARNEFLERTVEVRVGDGRLSIEIGGTTGNTTLDYVSIATARQPWLRVNFQPEDGPSPNGYRADWGAAFRPEDGIGWVQDGAGGTRRRDLHADTLLDTLIFIGTTAATWEAEVPFGDYAVTVCVGDAGYSQGPHWVRVEGVDVFRGETTAAGSFLQRTVRVPTRDGRLTVLAGGSSTGYTTVNYLTVDKVPDLAAVNFQPEWSARPVDFTQDSGLAWSADRGYGWEDDFLYASGRTRERNGTSDVALDTFIYTWSPAETWSLDVPYGDYEVIVAVGDAEHEQGPQRVIVEGVALVDGETTQPGSFLTRAACVTVADGKLSLEIGGLTGNTALDYARVSSASCPDGVEWVGPGAEWATATPAEMGMDEAMLIEAREYATRVGGSAFITRHGRLVMSWGDDTYTYLLYSATKSFGATALGIALRDGRLSLDTPVQQCHPDLGIPPDINLSTGWLDDIRIRHLASHTAGFPKGGGYGELLFEPGTAWHYSDGGANWLAECITLEYGEDLDTLMFDRAFTPIGITRADLWWRDNSYRPDTIEGIPRREFGSGIHANVDAMARLGYLYLRRGNWNGQQILPASFIDEVRVPSVPSLPVHDPGVNEPDWPQVYGLLWWNNADGRMPNVPRDAYWAWGLDDQVILVVPSLDIVVSRAGYGLQDITNYDSIEPFFELIVSSVMDAPSIPWP